MIVAINVVVLVVMLMLMNSMGIQLRTSRVRLCLESLNWKPSTSVAGIRLLPSTLKQSQRVLSTYVVECRVSVLGITII